MDDIKDIVNDVVRDLEKKQARQQMDIAQIWASCVTAKEAAHTKVEGIREGVLYVNADCSAWMFQCRLRYRSILQKVQADLPDVKRIYLKVGNIQ